jgi:hypothetical protein
MDKIDNQKGAGGMPVYYGARYQRGMGIGSMFSRTSFREPVASI